MLFRSVNISKNKKGIPKRKTPFFFTLKSLSNKQQLFFYFIDTLTHCKSASHYNSTALQTYITQLLAKNLSDNFNVGQTKAFQINLSEIFKSPKYLQYSIKFLCRFKALHFVHEANSSYCLRYVRRSKDLLFSSWFISKRLKVQ